MILEIAIVAVFGTIAGFVLVWILSKFGVHLPTKESRMKKKMLNNPELLVDVLNKNGRMVDMGEELKYSVVEKDGKKRVVVEKVPVKVKVDIPEAKEGVDEVSGEEGVVEDDVAEEVEPAERSEIMGRCMKCKEQKVIADAQLTTTKKGQPMIKGACSVCGCAMCRLLSKADGAKLIASGEFASDMDLGEEGESEGEEGDTVEGLEKKLKLQKELVAVKKKLKALGEE